MSRRHLLHTTQPLLFLLQPEPSAASCRVSRSKLYVSIFQCLFYSMSSDSVNLVTTEDVDLIIVEDFGGYRAFLRGRDITNVCYYSTPIYNLQHLRS